MPSVALTLSAGDISNYSSELARYESLAGWLRRNASSYGLASRLEDLDDVGIETLTSIYPEADTATPLRLAPPASLALPPLLIDLSASPSLSKTTANFLALASQPPSHVSKRVPGLSLGYTSEQGRKVFRIDQDFVAQMGDVTRGDGSGGESIYGGGTFKEEKEGLKTPFVFGTVGMASSGSSSVSSQFFLTLTSNPTKLKKLTGKYVAFARCDPNVGQHKETLNRLSELGDGKGGTSVPVWISECKITSYSS